MAYPLLGTRIVLDEEKIIREGKYDLESIHKAIDEYAEESGMIKVDKETYHCKGDKYDLGCITIFLYGCLIDSEWFTKNVKEWIWISEKEGNSDLISFLKKEKEGVWQ